MLDFQHLDDSARQNVQIFYGKNNATTSPLTDVWEKPRGVSMVQIFMLGQGSLGGSPIAGATSAGGAGGSSGAQSILLIPAQCIPDILYVGGGSGTTSNAVNTYVAVKPHGATFNSVPVASDIVLIAGGGSGSAGAAGTVATAILSGNGLAFFVGGQIGGAGGAATGAVGNSSAAAVSGLVCKGGAGGGGMSATVAGAGGVATTSFPSWYQTATVAPAGTSGVDGGRGGNGIWLPNGVRCSNAGSGGGAGFPTATTSNGGNGGNGGYGSGGGGGGGAVTGKTAGVGGLGGAGIVIITCW